MNRQRAELQHKDAVEVGTRLGLAFAVAEGLQARGQQAAAGRVRERMEAWVAAGCPVAW